MGMQSYVYIDMREDLIGWECDPQHSIFEFSSIECIYILLFKSILGDCESNYRKEKLRIFDLIFQVIL